VLSCKNSFLTNEAYQHLRSTYGGSVCSTYISLLISHNNCQVETSIVAIGRTKSRGPDSRVQGLPSYKFMKQILFKHTNVGRGPLKTCRVLTLIQAYCVRV